MKIAAALIIAIVLYGCGSRPYSRLEVVGAITAIEEDKIPDYGERLQPLPPLPAGYAIAPDTDDGTILMSIDQRQFFHDHGHSMPVWEPRRVNRKETDTTVSATASIVDNLRIVRESLDRMMLNGGEAAAQGQTATNEKGAPLVSYALTTTDWNKLGDKILKISENMSQVVETIRQSPATLNGSDEHVKRLESMWEGMDQRVATASAAAADLVLEGGYAAALKDQRYSDETRSAHGRMAQCALALQTAVAERSAPSVIPITRQLQRRIDEMETMSSTQAIFSAANPMSLSKEARDATRIRISWLRSRVVAVAAHWAQRQAEIISLPATTPELVWGPVSTLGQ